MPNFSNISAISRLGSRHLQISEIAAGRPRIGPRPLDKSLTATQPLLTLLILKSKINVKHECPRWQQSPKGANLKYKGHGQGHKVIELDFIWKGFISWVYMQLWSLYLVNLCFKSYGKCLRLFAIYKVIDTQTESHTDMTKIDAPEFHSGGIKINVINKCGVGGDSQIVVKDRNRDITKYTRAIFKQDMGSSFKQNVSYWTSGSPPLVSPPSQCKPFVLLCWRSNLLLPPGTLSPSRTSDCSTHPLSWWWSLGIV